MKKIIVFISIIILTTGCEKIFENIENTPMENYNLLFEYLNKDYAYKDEYPFTMDELKSRYLNNLKSNPSDEKLAAIFIKIEHDLLDPHFQPPNITYDLADDYSPNYTLENIETEQDDIIPIFKKEINIINGNDYFAYGTVKNHPTIGYIYIKELSDDFGGSGRLKGNKWKEKIELILQELNNMNVDKMIVDIRSEAGGSNYNALYITNRFANTTAPYMIEEYEKDNGEYGKITYTVTPKGEHHFREGKIALLSNNVTCSGGEMFVLAMLKRQNLIHIGTPSGGCAGTVIQRDLYNGWEFILTSSRTTFANGNSYFRKGIRPQIIVKNDSDYYTTEQDKLIERAIIELN